MNAEVLLFWFVCGLIAGAIYRGKGRSEAAGCLVGFFLGPIGILLAVLSSRNDKGLEKQALKKGEIKLCPYCAEPIRSQAVICKHCNSDVRGAFEDKRKVSML
jgi:hypothetical protein